jgi:hypothetical protein
VRLPDLRFFCEFFSPSPAGQGRQQTEAGKVGTLCRVSKTSSVHRTSSSGRVHVSVREGGVEWSEWGERESRGGWTRHFYMEGERECPAGLVMRPSRT